MAGEYTIPLYQVGSPGGEFTVHPLEFDGPSSVSTPREIVRIEGTGSPIVNNIMVVRGDITARFVNGFSFDIVNGGPNDGTYTVDGTATYNASDDTTEFDFTPAIATVSIPFGGIQYSVGASTSLVIAGRFTMNYGEHLATNLVKLVTNFAGDTSPASPNIGQMWFDTTTNEMKIFGGGSPGWSQVNEPDTVTQEYLVIDGSPPQVDPSDPITLPNGMEYTPGNNKLMVFLNGQKLIRGLDYTETDETTITWIGSESVLLGSRFEFINRTP